MEPGEPGIVASQAARFLYGLAIVLVVLFEPAGLAGLARRLRRRPSRASRTASADASGADQHDTTTPAHADPSTGGNN